MKLDGIVILRYIVIVGLACVLDGVEGTPKKGGKSGGKSKVSTIKKGVAVAAGAAGAAYVGHKIKKKMKHKGKFGDDDGLRCWLCGVPGSRMCPQGDGIVYRRNMTDDDNDAERRRLPGDDDDDDDDEDTYDSYFGAVNYCPEHADSCLTLYTDHSREKVLMRNCFDEGFFGCYDSVQGLSGFACFCRRDLCNGVASLAPLSLMMAVVFVLHWA
ncbi:unnamed protein product [Notodromas monacha]|uniref:Protein sleepless n=1 Tax=Notodromas monacha TaxID=399045 RepID=A0A7R9GFK1_9CRUS|nr:unnamed protein product [Notodromas monacha]CAG0919236.1 unnamed protein product [Notodromas monacha]